MALPWGLVTRYRRPSFLLQHRAVWQMPLRLKARVEDTEPSSIQDPGRGLKKADEEKEVDLAERAKELGVSLSPWEVRALVNRTLRSRGRSGKVTQSKLKQLALEHLEKDAERQKLVEAIAACHADSPAQNMLVACDLLGSSLFAAVGTLLACDAGMHIFGAAMVGCVSAVGGGTVNNILMGDTRQGVFWMRDLRYLYAPLAASLATFYSWPHLELWWAQHELDMIGPDCDGMVDPACFEAALERHPRLSKRLRSVIEPRIESSEPTPRDLFAWLCNGKDKCGLQEFRRLFRPQVENSGILYAMDSVALGIFGVLGAQAGVNRGLHPLICAFSGVTICFGGILRDLMCQRNVAFGSQSYAMYMGCGASVYVTLRLLVVRGWPIPLIYRIFLGAGTTVGLRILEWQA